MELIGKKVISLIVSDNLKEAQKDTKNIARLIEKYKDDLIKKSKTTPKEDIILVL